MVASALSVSSSIVEHVFPSILLLIYLFNDFLSFSSDGRCQPEKTRMILHLCAVSDLFDQTKYEMPHMILHAD